MGLFSFYVLDIDECTSEPCQNGGTCIAENNTYKCMCATGFNGQNCDNGKFFLITLFVSWEMCPVYSFVSSLREFFYGRQVVFW